MFPKTTHNDDVVSGRSHFDLSTTVVTGRGKQKMSMKTVEPYQLPGTARGEP